jgi:hypothetical protein
MLRVSLGATILGLSAMPIFSDANCDMAYGAFMERLSHRGASLSSSQLIAAHRSALRIFDACNSGHLVNFEAKFRALEGAS